jgi:hypothetical protein
MTPNRLNPKRNQTNQGITKAMDSADKRKQKFRLMVEVAKEKLT